MGWVGLGCVGSGWVEIFQFLVDWVGSTIAKVLKIYDNAFKARLDKIWLSQALNLLVVLGWVSQLMGWVGPVDNSDFHQDMRYMHVQRTDSCVADISFFFISEF